MNELIGLLPLIMRFVGIIFIVFGGILVCYGLFGIFKTLVKQKQEKD